VKRRTATYPRTLRVNQVLRQVIAEELERLADADERFRMVTVTSVDSAADMRTATVYLATLETDAAWAKTLAEGNFPNTEIRVTEAERIAADMTGLGRTFDAVIVDAATNRYRCARAALQILRPGGFILLDNADWYPNTTAMLRDADLIQVDFSDFRPLRWYRCCTSLFLHKDFRARPGGGRLPRPLIGGKDIGEVNAWDRISD